MIRHDLGALAPYEIAEALGVSVKRLFELGSNVEKHYHSTRIQRMKNGKERTLDVPKFFMKQLLRKLHKFLQVRCFYHDAAYGGVRRRSTFKAARKHLGKNAVSILDVSDCFPSVKTADFLRKLRSLGFRSDTARVLSGLMMCRDRIPQGSPTSNDALNLHLWQLDEHMCHACGESVTYTRMADDHVLSGPIPSDVEQAAQLLEKHLSHIGLRVNQKKKLKNGMKQAHQYQVVHSICVNDPTRTSIKKSQVRGYIQLADRYVRAAKAVSARSLPGVANLRRTLLGYINYCSQADLSPAKYLRRQMECGDRRVVWRLEEKGVSRTKNWWVRTKTVDCAVAIAKRWTSIEFRRQSKERTCPTTSPRGELALG